MLLPSALHSAVLPAAAALGAAVLPFLPSGRGALILILGGVAMLPLSLLWSRLASPPWTGGVERDAPRLGLGPCRVLARTRERCVVAVAACPTCSQAGHGPCERERRALQLAIHARAPRARVVEVSCNGSRPGAPKGTCIFEIHRGR